MTQLCFWLLRLFLFLAMLWPCLTKAEEWLPTPGPPTYSAEAIEAWVVDEKTGQPLEGVIVTANWQLYGGLHRSHVGQMMVMETVTDARGRFSFPAWGPKPRPVTGYLDELSPQLLLFKSAYAVRMLQNEPREKVDARSVRSSEWDSRIIKMKKFAGSIEEYAKHLGFLDRNLDSVFFQPNGNCEWKQIPRMLVAIHLEEKHFKEKGILTNRTPILNKEDRAEWAEPSKCGSMREFLRSYLP